MGGKELVARASGALDLRELAARTTLRYVRQKGHIYVELRQAGKRPIFFCTLCLTQCFSDQVLLDHLGGSLHARRYAAAKATLFGPDPWPFSDGVLFFNPACEKDGNLSASAGARNGGEDEVTSRFRDGGCNRHIAGGADTSIVVHGHTKPLKSKGSSDACRTIRGVLLKEQVSNLKVELMGLGHVATRIQETDEGRNKISRIWCAWLGRGDSINNDGLLVLPKCDFAIVSFTYAYDLGRHWTLGDTNSPRSEGSCFRINEDGSLGKKGKKSFSDPEDSSDSLTITNGASDDATRHLQISRFVSSKSFRQEVRKRKRLAAEKTCDICAQQMILGKDVGTLLNCKTGNLACSSRNTNGAFHIFHVSCLVHWILLCEFETSTDKLGDVKPKRGRKRKDALNKKISSVFCPECQGTGKHIVGEELEKPTVPLSEVFLYKLKAIEAHKAWMKNPEVLEKCSTGLHFPSDSTKKFPEKVMPGNLLRFYRADA